MKKSLNNQLLFFDRIRYGISILSSFLVLFLSSDIERKTAHEMELAYYRYANFSFYNKEEAQKPPKLAKSAHETEAERYWLDLNAKWQQSKNARSSNQKTNDISILNDVVELNGELTQIAVVESRFGFRADESAYDRLNDKLYVVSSSGILWYVNKDEVDVRNTTWVELNNKLNFNSGFVETIALPNGTTRLLSGHNRKLHYSDDEGRTWQEVAFPNLNETWLETATQILPNGSERFFVIANVGNRVTVLFTENGVDYVDMDLDLTYSTQFVDPPGGNEIFMITHDSQRTRVNTFRFNGQSLQFDLLHATTVDMPSGNMYAFGSYIDGAFHLYMTIAKSHIYYSDNEGEDWTLTREIDANMFNVRLQAADIENPNVLFRGDTDFFISEDNGANFQGTGRRFGWDMRHFDYYTKVSGEVFFFVGNDFGSFMSYTPSDVNTYINLNQDSKHIMAYDADYSPEYGNISVATQDRGTFVVDAQEFSTSSEVRSTDGLRTTFANRGKSVWTTMYFNSIYRIDNPNNPMGNERVSARTGDGNWWSTFLVPSPDDDEDAVYWGGRTYLRKFEFDPQQSANIIKTDHPYIFPGNVNGFGYSRVNRDRWYVATNNGDMYYSTDGGTTFEQSSITGAQPFGSFNWQKQNLVIKTSKRNENIVYYAGGGNRFLISDDGGVTFSEHIDGLNVARFTDFDVTEDDAYIYATCAGSGLYVYSAELDRWFPILHEKFAANTRYTAVDINDETGEIFFTGYGCGVYRFTPTGFCKIAIENGVQVNEVSFDNTSQIAVCETDTVQFEVSPGEGGPWQYKVVNPSGIEVFQGLTTGEENIIVDIGNAISEGRWNVNFDNNFGCSGSTTYEIDIFQLTPSQQEMEINGVLVNAGEAAPICMGSEVTLRIDSDEFTSFEWYLPNGARVDGVSESQFSFTVTNPNGEEGTYVVRASNGLGCFSEAQFSLDSIVSTEATETNVTVCNGAVYTFEGQEYSSGTYTFERQTEAGCSYNYTLNVNEIETSFEILGPSEVVFCEDSQRTITASGGGSYLWSTGETSRSIQVTTSGVYTVLITNDQGCSGEATVVVEIVPTQTFFQDADGDGYGDAGVQMTGCTALEGWVDNGLDCNDEDAGTYPGALDIPDDGIDQNCKGGDVVSIADEQPSFTMYPVPTTDMVYVNGFDQKGGNAMIRVYATNGELVFQKLEAITENMSIDLSVLAPGTYLVSIELMETNETYQKPIIVN